ncbi:hypothetical protein [Pandoraea sp. NPDC087047]|uniref:hypothetical protein n=1 Tax=Pandoraea sp. NPDC087047 TaxID=3364390 RepID=UPI0038280725
MTRTVNRASATAAPPAAAGSTTSTRQTSSRALPPVPVAGTSTMAADWRGGADTRTGTAAGRQADAAPPLCLWSFDDPEPEWVPPGVAAQEWADFYGVNTRQLIRLGSECTRYGVVNLGEHRFIVGPTASAAEAQVLTRLLKAHPQIGAVFCVEPGKMQHGPQSGKAGETADSSGYQERPISDYITAASRRGVRSRESSAQQAQKAPERLDGGLSHVQFMEFTGMERFDGRIDGETLWRSGRGVAEFMRQNPGKIALVCSERGIARPCAVIASAALQLGGGDVRLRSLLCAEVIAQRAEVSDHHINMSSRSFDLIAELSRLTTMLRSPGRGAPRGERKVHLLRQQLPEATADVEVDWQSDKGRRKLADILEVNFKRIAPLLASGGLPSGTALLWLRDEINVLRGVRFLTPSYVGGHIDRISQDDIDPESPDAVRLVSFDDYGLTCDNKFYDVASVTDWYRRCRRRNEEMTNPVSRASVVAVLVKTSEMARLEPRFRNGSE